MGNGQGDCECQLCDKTKKPAKRPREATITSSQPRASKRQVDSSDIALSVGDNAQWQPPEPFRKFLRDGPGKGLITTAKFFNRAATSFQTEVEKEQLRLAGDYARQHSFLPRSGETIVYFTEPGTLRYNADTQIFVVETKVDNRTYYDTPTWKAGIVCAEQTPETTAAIEACRTSQQGLDWITSSTGLSFYIQLCPDPQDPVKDRRKFIEDVPLSHIRPLSMFAELLSRIDQSKWHKSISFAAKTCPVCCPAGLTQHVLSSEKQIDLYYRGLFAGPELIVKGDAVRLYSKHKDQDVVNSVMVVEDITISLTAKPPSLTPQIHGQVFYRRANMNHRHKLSHNALHSLPASMRGYDWYSSLDAETSSSGIRGPVMTCTVERIAGRCYEKSAMTALIAADDIDVAGIHILRKRTLGSDAGFFKQGREGWRLCASRETALGVSDKHILYAQILQNEEEARQERKSRGRPRKLAQLKADDMVSRLEADPLSEDMGVVGNGSRNRPQSISEDDSDVEENSIVRGGMSIISGDKAMSEMDIDGYMEVLDE